MIFKEKANFIWSMADLLRGDFKQSEYGKVILPFTVLRRFDCVLDKSKAKILEMNKKLTISNKTPVFKKYTGHDYYNVSEYDFEKLLDDSNAIETNLRDYINGFSDEVKEILENFEIEGIIERLRKVNLLYLVVEKFSQIDLTEETVDNLEMGYMFEELIRKFSEQSNESAGEHFTPREVIELMVKLILHSDEEELKKEGVVRTIYDLACGTGGMLSVAQNKMIELNKHIKIIPFGQELNPETYAACKSDMILKGNTNSRIVLGNSFSEDGFKYETFDYMLSNPPFGVDWKKVENYIKEEAKTKGFKGRFGAGTPRISDGSLLFLQHMVSKMKPAEEGGSRVAIIFNGSPLFSGDAATGESNIRKWIIENDMLEAIVSLPDQLFYNTGILIYIWILTNRKKERRQGKVRLVNGVSCYERMRKSMGSKRNIITDENLEEIVRLYTMEEPNENYIDFDNEDFGYYKITVDKPVVDEYGNLELDKKGQKKADAGQRSTENVPLKENIQDYFKREILPYAPDAWVDESKTKIGYEIPFTRYFYKYKGLRSTDDLRKDIRELEEEITKNLSDALEF